MANKLQHIDELLQPDHYYLEGDDICLFYGEYTARKRAAYSDINQLIFNFKKTMDRKGQKDWKYKTQAIQQVSEILTSLEAWNVLKDFTWIPIPPSKSKSDPDHDDRLIRTLSLMKQHYSAMDVREIVVLKNSRGSAHGSEDRPTPEDHYNNYSIDESQVRPEPKGIVVFDDVITTGAGFKAMKRILSERFGNIRIVGLFIARTIREDEGTDL